MPTVLLSAAAGAGVGVFVARNFSATAKKIRHEITTDFGADDPSFVRTMSDLLGPPLLPGNRVTLLNNGAETFPAMLEAIRGAQRTVTFENFDWEEGRLTRELSDALAERADDRNSHRFHQRSQQPARSTTPSTFPASWRQTPPTSASPAAPAG